MERGWDVRAFVEAATGLPTILFTTALVVVVCFWLLVASGVAEVNSFDADMDLDAWSLGGVPVAVAISLLTGVAWTLSTVATVLLVAFAPVGIVAGALRLTVPVGALVAAWLLTCLAVRPLRRLHPHEPGSRGPAGVVDGGLTGPAGVVCDEADEPLRSVLRTAPEGLSQTRGRAA
ncbi:hypothetical protein AB5J49_03215 [Streptomyces sp. R28]|uniref:Uncharacterized protein n=1 Tax=Streptomyces sp. R28 TaxID=3238628 RepID=A0AB39PPE3_9ACTN